MSNPHVTRERIDDEVKKALAATLRKEPADIDLTGSIVKDLGATSIDFLDINFSLERAFDIQLATQLLLDSVEEQVGEGKAIDGENRITEPAAKLLRLYFGDLDAIKPGIFADEIPSLVTGTIVADGVARIVDQLPEHCTHCNASEWKSDDGVKVVCGACGEPAEYPNGDDLVESWIEQVQAEHQLFPA